MRRLIIAGLTALLVFAGAAAPAYGQDPGEGSVTGRVINDTAGGGSMGDVEVILLTYVDDTLADTTTTRTDGEGNFRFDGVSLDNQYIVAANYMEVEYYYQVVFEPGETTAYVEVGVCDATESDALIRAGVNHKIVDVEEASFRVTEFLHLINDGDRTYVREDGGLDFTLPEGAYGFEAPQELMADFRFAQENVLSYLAPFPPGEKQIIYAYRLERTGADEVEIPLAIDYPSDSVEVLVFGEGIEVTMGQLAPADPVVTDTGERYIHFHGENISRNTVLSLDIANLSGGKGFPLYVLWIIIGVVVTGLAVYVAIRRGTKGGVNDQ
jgi:hypothetical protein